jgi:hypothetical protein
MIDASKVAMAEIESVSKIPLPIFSKRVELRSGGKKRAKKGAILDSE